MTVEGLKVRDGMTLTVGERVEVYYNIQKGGFSILKKGKLVAHADYVTIADATFHINENKLARILEINRKTVYATVRGVFVGASESQVAGHRRGYCNPFKTGAFIDFENGSEVTSAKEVYFYDKFFSYRG